MTLFAGETFGVAAAVTTALIFVANFAVWWFGRFAMSEPLTIAFLWGAFVFLGRGLPVTAGVMLESCRVGACRDAAVCDGGHRVLERLTLVRPREVAVAVGALAATTLATAGPLAAPIITSPIS